MGGGGFHMMTRVAAMAWIVAVRAMGHDARHYAEQSGRSDCRLCAKSPDLFGRRSSHGGRAPPGMSTV